MKILSLILTCGLWGLAGCHSRDSVATNDAQPGPALGHVVGTVAGAVPGQVIGGTASAVEAVSDQIKAPFDHPKRQIVRKWETVTTSDGRTVQVAREYYVDENGEIIGPVEPSK